MTNILLITYRFFPPWSDGIASYAKGLVDTILETSRLKSGLETTVISSMEGNIFPKFNSEEMKYYLETRNGRLETIYASKKSYKMNLWKLIRDLLHTKDYDVTHVILPGFNPLLLRFADSRRKIILKHIFIYPFHSGFAREKLAYKFFKKSSMSRLFNIDLAFSSEILQKIYQVEGLTILPPAIDTSYYRFKPKLDCYSETFMESSLKFGSIDKVLQKDFVLLYMGPILNERFEYKNIINGFMKLRKDYDLDVGFAIVGREFGDISYFKEMKDYINKYDLINCVFACIKNLSESEKICLFNNVDIFVYPFFKRLHRMSVVFPPIALLESMSAGLCVVSGGLPYLSYLIKNNKNGILIKENINDITFAEGIWNALICKRKISQNARLTIEQNFSIPCVSKLYANFLSRIGI